MKNFRILKHKFYRSIRNTEKAQQAMSRPDHRHTTPLLRSALAKYKTTASRRPRDYSGYRRTSVRKSVTRILPWVLYPQGGGAEVRNDMLWTMWRHKWRRFARRPTIGEPVVQSTIIIYVATSNPV
jgi:hypothetical protein